MGSICRGNPRQTSRTRVGADARATAELAQQSRGCAARASVGPGTCPGEIHVVDRCGSRFVKLRAPRALLVLCCALLCLPAIAIGDEDDEAADSSRRSARPTISRGQQRAAGIAVAHPLAAKAPERIEGLGLVLDATTLVSDMADTTTSTVSQRSASPHLPPF